MPRYELSWSLHMVGSTLLRIGLFCHKAIVIARYRDSRLSKHTASFISALCIGEGNCVCMTIVTVSSIFIFSELGLRVMVQSELGSLLEGSKAQGPA